MADRYDPLTLLHYLEGDLSQEQRDEFEATLAKDKHLRQLVDELLADRGGLRNLPPEQAPPQLVDDAIQHLERQMLLGSNDSEPEVGQLAPEVHRFRIGKFLTYSAIAAVVLISGGVVFQSIYDIDVLEQTRKWRTPTEVAEHKPTRETVLVESQPEKDVAPTEPITIAMADMEHVDQPDRRKEALSEGEAFPADQRHTDRLAMAKVEQSRSESTSDDFSAITDKLNEPGSERTRAGGELAKSQTGRNDLDALSETAVSTTALSQKPKLALGIVAAPETSGMVLDEQPKPDSPLAVLTAPASMQINITTQDSEMTHQDLLAWAVSNTIPIVDEQMAIAVHVEEEPQGMMDVKGSQGEYNIVSKQRQLTLQMNEEQLPQLISHINSRLYQNAALSNPETDSNLANEERVPWGQLLQSQLPLVHKIEHKSTDQQEILVPVIICEPGDTSTITPGDQ